MTSSARRPSSRPSVELSLPALDKVERTRQNFAARRAWTTQQDLLFGSHRPGRAAYRNGAEAVSTLYLPSSA